MPSYGIYTFTYEALLHNEALEDINEHIRMMFAGGMAGIPKKEHHQGHDTHESQAN